MKRMQHTLASPRLWQSLAILALLMCLAGTQVASAEVYDNTITLYAQDAPAGAWICVEWQAPDGTWHDVTGWEGNWDTLEDSDLQFKQWAVSPKLADQKNFRWMVYTQQGGEVWGVSPTFSLPGGHGVNLSMTIEWPLVPAAVTPKPAVTPVVFKPVVVPATNLPVVPASFTTFGLAGDGPSDHSHITLFLPKALANGYAYVQYQDAVGAWQDVKGWMGNVLNDDDIHQPYAQWAVARANYGQGPFRWVVLDGTGALWGVSPTFKLPAHDGLDLTLFMGNA